MGVRRSQIPTTLALSLNQVSRYRLMPSMAISKNGAFTYGKCRGLPLQKQQRTTVWHSVERAASSNRPVSKVSH